MTKRRKDADTPDEAGNARSSDEPGQARPWTDEEMAEARPLPLPTVDPVTGIAVAGVPNSGKGQTKAGGRPEKDEASK